MNKFQMWFANIMRGRYGNDELNRFLMFVALGIIILRMVISLRILYILLILIFIVAYSRMFSRSINARYAENQKFLKLKADIMTKFGGVKKGQKGRTFGGGEDPNHKILRCPSCGERLRVPRGKGKIEIKCPHCNTKFVKKV